MDLEKGTSINIEAGNFKIAITRQPDSIIRGLKDNQTNDDIISACDTIMLFKDFCK